MFPPSDSALVEGFAFRGAAHRPSTAREGVSSEVDVDRSLKRHGRSQLTPRNVLLLMGTLILLLIIVAPLWDATRLLDDPSFVFFMGRTVPVWTVIACLSAVFVYILTMSTYFWCASSEARNEQAVIMINVVILTALGLSFLALSQPLLDGTSAVHRDLFTNCEHGVHTRKVAAYAARLQVLRQSPACTGEHSVEQCEGFESSQPMVGFLKSLESQSQCAGFCLRPGMAQPAAQGHDEASPQDAASDSSQTEGNATSLPVLLTRAAKPQQQGRQVQLKSEGLDVANPAAPPKGLANALARFAQSSSLLQVEPGLAPASEGRATMLTQQLKRASQTDNGVQSTSAKALFSQAVRDVSCEGVSGRALMVQATSTGRTLYWEGILLLIIAVIASLSEVSGLFFLASRPKDMGPARQIAF